MSRYIDAEYVNAFPIRIDHYDEEHGNRHFVLGIESVMEYIEEAPSIDIVRCGKCKWYGNEQKKIYECCTYWAQDGGVLVPTKPDDFCSYGERKESES